MSEPSKAQLRSEAEVARIMKERGIDRNYKPKKRSISVRPSIIVAFIICAACVAAYFTKGFGFLEKPSSKTTTPYYGSSTSLEEYRTEVAALRDCIASAGTEEISQDDSEFWNKYITRYETILGCYDAHPTATNSNERQQAESNLAQIRDFASQDNITNTEISQKLAELDASRETYMAELAQRHAEIDAETERKLQEIYDRQAEMEAEYAEKRAENEATLQAHKEELDRIAAEKEAECNEMRLTLGDKDAATLANEDSETQRDYNTWQSWLQSANEWEARGTHMTQAQCNTYTINGRICPEHYKDKATEAQKTYESTLARKTSYYETRISTMNSQCNQ